jgi:hypothetical protein
MCGYLGGMEGVRIDMSPGGDDEAGIRDGKGGSAESSRPS